MNCEGFTFIVMGEAVPQQRPRVTTRGGIRLYDPDVCVAWKRWVGVSCAQAMQDMKCGKIDSPVALEIEFHLEAPKSLPKKQRDCHVRKPDLDNLVKGLCDGLNNVLYVDDNRVVKLIATKQYAKDKPFVRITVTKEGQ